MTVSDFWTSLWHQNSVDLWPDGLTVHAALRCVEAKAAMRSLWASDSAVPIRTCFKWVSRNEKATRQSLAAPLSSSDENRLFGFDWFRGGGPAE